MPRIDKAADEAAEAVKVDVKDDSGSKKKRVKEPKIHLQKYLNDKNSYSSGQIEILRTLFRREMHTRSEWEKIIEAEFARTYH